MRIGLPKQALDKAELILLQYLSFIVTFFYQIAQFLLQIVEEHRILVYVLKEIASCRQPVFFKLNVPVSVIEIQHGIERMVIESVVAFPCAGVLITDVVAKIGLLLCAH